MIKYSEIYGVDISKDVFDVFGSLTDHCQFKNTDRGFNAFAKALLKQVFAIVKSERSYNENHVSRLA